MRDPILIGVKNFLESKWRPGRPLLLGYSGGPDSKALLYLLLECRRFFPLDLHLAHIDHSWRSTSQQEAEGLQKEALELNLPYHLHTLSPSEFLEGNWEEQGRLKRFEFFSALYRDGDFQALLLGHQAGDHAETVLKRLFEGSHFYSLGSVMKPCSLYEGMHIWRPLLPYSKEELIYWLDKKRLGYLIDPTNESAQFLRGKMRAEILPFLNKSFGKNISKNLRQIAEEAVLLKDFFSQVNRSLYGSLCLHEKPLELDLAPHLPLHALQLKFLLKEWLEQHQLSVSREILEGIVVSLDQKGKVRKFQTGKAGFLVHKQKICISFYN